MVNHNGYIHLINLLEMRPEFLRIQIKVSVVRRQRMPDISLPQMEMAQTAKSVP